MTIKEKFLAMKTWDEYMENREKEGLGDLDCSDKEVQKHFREIQPEVDPPFGPRGEIEYLKKP